MRFLAPQTLAQQAKIAAAFGIQATGRSAEAIAAEAAEAVEGFIDSFDVPRRLRDVGAKEDELAAVAQAVIQESSMWHTQQGAEEAMLGLMQAMW